MARSFRGGITPEPFKLTAGRPLEEMQAPSFVTLPLSHPGTVPAIPVVEVGQRVLKGQKIAEMGQGESVSVFASVSGTVSAIGSVQTHFGESISITIENDFKEEISPDITPFDTPISKAEPERLCRYIKEKGIVSMSGDAFPTWAKIESAGNDITRLIINCAESEPYLSSTHRLLLEKTEEILGGVKILLRATGAERAIFALENDKEDAVDALSKVLGKSPAFAVAVLKSKYPQGDERQLVRALLGKEIPQNKKAKDLRALVISAETCLCIYRAFVTGLPPVTRALTVNGNCIKEPLNLVVPMGADLRSVIDRAGGFSLMPDKIIAGGPMMGLAQWTTFVPVTAGVTGVIAMRSDRVKASACIRCGKCVKACPSRLLPLELSRAVKTGNVEMLKQYHIEACNGCGCCTYVCPAKIPILQNIRAGKEMLAPKNEA